MLRIVVDIRPERFLTSGEFLLVQRNGPMVVTHVRELPVAEKPNCGRALGDNLERSSTPQFQGDRLEDSITKCRPWFSVPLVW
jgi:hypothetical protein